MTRHTTTDSFGNKLLHRAYLSVHSGEVAALLGPNGARTTTIVRIRSTLIVPDSDTASIMSYF